MVKFGLSASRCGAQAHGRVTVARGAPAIERRQPGPWGPGRLRTRALGRYTASARTEGFALSRGCRRSQFAGRRQIAVWTPWLMPRAPQRRVAMKRIVSTTNHVAPPVPEMWNRAGRRTEKIINGKKNVDRRHPPGRDACGGGRWTTA